GEADDGMPPVRQCGRGHRGQPVELFGSHANAGGSGGAQGRAGAAGRRRSAVSGLVKRAATSIKDIARAANVSHSTVSRALRDSSLVNHETAERIRRLARDSGFRVSAVARSLATGRTSTLGVVVTAIANPFNAEVVEGIEEAANARG